jgi:hypothetical protein
MTYAAAFPTFPADAMPALPAGFYDASYRNDVCPRYTSDDDRVSIWIDFPDPDAREYCLMHQYRVTLASIDDDIVLETDDWSEALEAALMLANAE